MIYTDLYELKLLLELDPLNTVEDAKLSLFVEMAGTIIEGLLNRDFIKKERTEYYGGCGTQQILLRHRPAYTTPVPQVWVDQNGYFGASSGSFQGSDQPLVYGQDFCFDTPEEGQPSKSGLLIRVNNYWPRPAVRSDGLLSPYLGISHGNVKITYTAGYTVDTLPADFRFATISLVTKMRGFMPVGYELSSDGYEDKTISIIAERRDYLTATAKQILWRYRNWRF